MVVCRRPAAAAATEYFRFRYQSKSRPIPGVPKPIYWRRSATDDLREVAERFGADLADVHLKHIDDSWFHYDTAVDFLIQHGVLRSRRDVKLIDMLEVFAGCGHLTQACVNVGMCAPLTIDIRPSLLSELSWDLLAGHWRRMLWAVMVVFRPQWAHSGFPCRFWVRLTHFKKKCTPAEYELWRLTELVFVIVTIQLAYYQKRAGKQFSMEQPPQAMSWGLDIMDDMVEACGMRKHFFASCAWNHRDPGSGILYLKKQCVASFADLSVLERSCQCTTLHQKVEGVVCSGPEKGRKRSSVSGAYPVDLCAAWAHAIRSSLSL